MAKKKLSGMAAVVMKIIRNTMTKIAAQISEHV
jgi:hypothetical protein